MVQGRLTVSDIDPELEHELEALGVRWTFSPLHRGGTRRWFLCPNTTCGRRCAVLYLAGADLICWSCRKARLDLRSSSADPERVVRATQVESTVPNRSAAVAKPLTPARVAARDGRRPRELIQNCK